MNVKVFQWPCGTLATSRSPRGERPEWRTILVVTDVSSIKTRRFARKDDCSAFSSARAAATSGRSCSAACSVFFEADAVTLVEAPHRAGCGFQLLVGAKPRANLIERQIGLRRNEIEQPLAMLLKRRAGVAGPGLGFDAAGRRPAIDPADRSRGADVEQTPRLACALAGLHDRDCPYAQILRVSLRHRPPRRCRRRKQNLICAPQGIPCNCPDSHQAKTALGKRKAPPCEA